MRSGIVEGVVRMCFVLRLVVVEAAALAASAHTAATMTSPNPDRHSPRRAVSPLKTLEGNSRTILTR